MFRRYAVVFSGEKDITLRLIKRENIRKAFLRFHKLIAYADTTAAFWYFCFRGLALKSEGSWIVKS